MTKSRTAAQIAEKSLVLCLSPILGAAVSSQSVQGRFPYQNDEEPCAYEEMAWTRRKKTDLPVTLAKLRRLSHSDGYCRKWDQDASSESVGTRAIPSRSFMLWQNQTHKRHSLSYK